MKLSREGYSLPEVLISVLLVAAIAMAVMSVSVTSKKAGVTSNTTLMANEAVRHLSDNLKAYVTDPNMAGNGTARSLGFPVPGGGPNGWSLPGERGWALSPGVVHTIPINSQMWKRLVPPQLQPYNPTLTYTVQQVPVGGMNSNKVDIKLTWNPPQ